FVIWGLWHGTFLVIERVLTRGKMSTSPGASAPSGITAWPIWPHVYTLLVVMIGWVFFRAETLGGALSFLAAMAGLGPAATAPFTVGFFLPPELWIALAAGAIGSTPWVSALAARERRAGGRPALDLAAAAALLAVFVASVVQVAARTYNPFIYFRF